MKRHPHQPADVEAFGSFGAFEQLRRGAVAGRKLCGTREGRTRFPRPRMDESEDFVTFDRSY